MLFLDEVPLLDPRGGPWGLGYLRAEAAVRPDDWYFEGHFKNDPCMPGTLMFEGCLQAMSFYLASQGRTVDRDGWRFEPVLEQTYRLRCRGQVLPDSKRIVYELFVRELGENTLVADLLCTVDGLKVFHCPAMGWQLVPDWPADGARLPELRPCADWQGFRFNESSMLACALGRPSQAFGPQFALFDGQRRTPRLPGPPYLFLSRVTRIDAELGKARSGAVLEAEYDIPPDAWYLDSRNEMPLCVLMEAALQPCGWLATYLGITLNYPTDLFFRNLDGTATQNAPVRGGVLKTRVTATNIASSGGTIIESFQVQAWVEDGALAQAKTGLSAPPTEEPVLQMQTVFGHFSKESLALQAGLSAGPGWESQPGVSQPWPLPSRGPLQLLDEVTGFWPDQGLGRLRAEKTIDPDAWFFKAHFFQDPVQPGSLGVEAMLDTVKACMILKGLGADLQDPVFEPLALGESITWKYRGQVLPHNRKVVVSVELCSIEPAPDTVLAVAHVWLSVDGCPIYEATRLPMRLKGRRRLGPSVHEVELRPDRETWLRDHCPAYVPEIPTLPATAMLEQLLAAAPGMGLDDVSFLRWVSFQHGAQRLRVEVSSEQKLTLRVGEQICARGAAVQNGPRPPALTPILGESVEPYADGHLFHGPAFHLVTALQRDGGAASSKLAWSDNFTILLDAALHGIPHDRMGLWISDVAPGLVAFPCGAPRVRIFGAHPSRESRLRSEVRLLGRDGPPLRGARIHFHVQLLVDDSVWIDMLWDELLVDTGPLGQHPPEERMAFLAHRQPVAGMALSSQRPDGSSELRLADLRATDWLPGLLQVLYGSTDSRAIASREHVARLCGGHPGWVDEQGVSASCPLDRHALRVTLSDRVVEVVDEAATVDYAWLRRRWDRLVGVEDTLFYDLMEGLARVFLGQLEIARPESWRGLEGRPVLYLANHQVQAESALFGYLLGGWSGVPVAALARAEHDPRRGNPGYWLGYVVESVNRRLGPQSPPLIAYFDQNDPSSLGRILGAPRPGTPNPLSRAPLSLLVHANGTRSLGAREPVENLSSVLLDVAILQDLPVVPAWISGGLPVEPAKAMLDFPIGWARQSYRVGAPIRPEELRSWPYGDRRRRVLDAINALAPADESPAAPQPDFFAEVGGWAAIRGGRGSKAAPVLLALLSRVPHPSPETQAFLEEARSSAGRFDVPELSEFAEWLLGVAVNTPRICAEP